MNAPIHDDVTALAALPGPLMGLDLGTKTIGVAVSDTLRISATALETVRRSKFSADAARLEEIIAGRGIAAIVLGLPRNMDGSEGSRCQSTRAFARNLAVRIAQPIAFWDECASTRKRPDTAANSPGKCPGEDAANFATMTTRLPSY